MALLDVRNLTFTYPEQSFAAVKDVSFTVNAGEMLLISGQTGSGKSTLLRLLKRELAPVGDLSGFVRFDETPLCDLPARRAAAEIGYVTQYPDAQIVTDTVRHELAFGLENLGFSQAEMARRVAETAAYFGMEEWYDRAVHTLSGGQKQLLCLAAAMVTRPRLLLLDEPTAQLDPIAAAAFLTALSRLIRDTGLTVVMCEHRTEEALSLCDKLLILQEGGCVAFDEPRAAVAAARKAPAVFGEMPAAARIWEALGGAGECPLSVAQGQRLVAQYRNAVRAIPRTSPDRGEEALRFSNVHMRYTRAGKDVLCGLDLTVYQGEICCLVGGNGSGKTTALAVASGLAKPYAGQVHVFGKKLKSYAGQSLYRNCLTMLPQDVQTVFLKSTVRAELADAGALDLSLPFELKALYDRHPYDLSGGEQQLVALAKVLATRPRLLLLDEPTKGLDALAKQGLITVLHNLREQGVTVLVVTHDVEFAAACADRCALLFCGRIAACGEPGEFFADNHFYTTAAARISRGHYDRAVTVEEVVALCRQNGWGDAL